MIVNGLGDVPATIISGGMAGMGGEVTTALKNLATGVGGKVTGQLDRVEVALKVAAYASVAAAVFSLVAAWGANRRRSGS